MRKINFILICFVFLSSNCSELKKEETTKNVLSDSAINEIIEENNARIVNETDSTLKYYDQVESFNINFDMYQNFEHLYKLKNFTSLKSITISGNNINDIDSVLELVKDLPSLKRIEIYLLKIDKIPDNLFNCVQITDLTIDADSIRNISDKIGGLKNLEELHLMTCINDLPQSFKKLESLRKLSVGNNFKYPKKIPGVILKLTKLEYLDFSGSGLKSLPADLSTLKKLKRLNICTTPYGEYEKAYYDIHGKYDDLERVKKQLPKCWFFDDFCLVSDFYYQFYKEMYEKKYGEAPKFRIVDDPIKKQN